MRPLRNPSGPHARLSGALRALALEGTPSHGRGRRVRSLVAPREGEGRRTGWRSAAKRELHGGCDRIGQRAEAEKFFTRATALADAGLEMGSAAGSAERLGHYALFNRGRRAPQIGHPGELVFGSSQRGSGIDEVGLAGDGRHSTPAQVAAVDAAPCATRAVSRLRKSKPYAQR